MFLDYLQQAIASFEAWFARVQFGADTRTDFYETLMVLLDGNQMQLSEVLQQMHDIASENGSKPDQPMAVILKDLIEQLVEGAPFSVAMIHWIPPEEVALIAAAEKSGQIRQSLEDAVQIIAAKQKIFGAALSGISYPLLLLAIVAALLVEVSLYLVPKLEKVTPPEHWEGSARILYMISSFVTQFGPFLLGGGIVLTYFVIWSMPRLCGPFRVYLDKVFPWSINRVVKGSAFMLTLAVMLSNGIQMLTALNTLAEHATPWLRERIERAIEELGDGSNLGDAFHRAGHGFPDPMAIQFLRVLSSRDGFANAIKNFSVRWLKKSMRNIQISTRIILIIALLADFGLLALIVISTFDIGNSVSTAAH